MLHRMRTSIESMAVGNGRVLRKFLSWDRSYQDRGGCDMMRTGGNISVLVGPCPVLKGQTSRPCSICKALPGTDLSPWVNMGPRKSLSPLLHSLRHLQRSKDETITRNSDGDLLSVPGPGLSHSQPLSCLFPRATLWGVFQGNLGSEKGTHAFPVPSW